MPKYIDLLGDAIRIGIQTLGTLTRYVGLTSDGPVLEVRGGVVIQAELAQGKLAGRYSSGAGEIQPITPSGGLAIDGSGNLTYSGGISDHDDLGNLDWDLSGHVGDADKIAAFDSAGVAAYLAIGPNLTVTGSTLQSSSPWKAVARLATTTAGTLATDFDNGSTIDGVTLVTGDRILLKDQSPSDDNGLYTVNASGAPTRAVDASTDLMSRGLAVWITEGSVNAHTLWVIDSDPVAAGNYRFKRLVKTGSGDVGILAQTASGTQGREITGGSNVYVKYGTGISGNPEISVKGSVGVCGRLTLESGVPFSTTNQTGKTTVYWTPYNGPFIPIYDSTVGDFVNRSSGEIDTPVPSTVFRLYDIFAYYTGSVVDLETTDWNQTTASVSAFNAGTQTFTTSAAHGCSVGDYVGFASITGTVGTDSTYGVNGKVWKVATVPTSTTFTLEGSNLGSLAYTSGGTLYRIPNTRATALTLVNGICVKSGDSTRTYLGTGMTWGTSGQTEMSFGSSDCKLLLWNKYNQLPTTAQTYNYASHSYTSGAWRFWNLNPANAIWSVSGDPTSAFALLAADGQAGEGYTAIGFDSITGNNNPFKNNNTYQVAGGVPGVWARQYPGLNGIRAVEYGATGWASTYVSLQLYMDM